MRFQIENKETGNIVVPTNYYFVILQNGELWTVNHDLSFTKADDEYEVIAETSVCDAPKCLVKDNEKLNNIKTKTMAKKFYELEEQVNELETTIQKLAEELTKTNRKIGEQLKQKEKNLTKEECIVLLTDALYCADGFSKQRRNIIAENILCCLNSNNYYIVKIN